MEAIATKTFDTIARMIYSHGIVTFFMLFITSSMIFFSHGLFFQVVPESMEPWERSLATWLMALGWESTVLMTTCNPKHVHRVVAVTVSVASGFIVLFFFEAYDLSQPPIVIVQRWFIGILAGTINSVFARLFHQKWMEVNRADSVPIKLAQRDIEIQEARAALAHAVATVNQRDTAIAQLGSDLAQRDAYIKQLQLIAIEYDDSRRCEHCGQLQDSPTSLNAHKGHCKKKHKSIAQKEETIQ